MSKPRKISNYSHSQLKQILKATVSSSVTLGNSLDLILLLDGVWVTLSDTLGSGNELIGEGLANALMASEGSFSGSFADQIDGLVDSSHWRDIDSLSSDSTSRTNSSRVLSGTTLDDSLKQDFQWVWAGEKMNDLKDLSEDSDSLLLFTILSVVTTHELIDKSFNDWALHFLETFFLIFTSSVWNVHLSLDFCNTEVIDQWLLWALNSFISPFAEKHGGDSST